MFGSSFDSAGVSAAQNDHSRGAAQAAAPREQPHAARRQRVQASLPETVPESVGPAPAPVPETMTEQPVAHETAPAPEVVTGYQEQAPKHPQPSRETAAARAARSASGLMLDLEAVAHVEGLAEEVAMLRASIRELAHPRGDLSEHVKILAELRHQVEALCSTLKAQQALESREGGPAELNRTLDELGDRLGVSR
jgi:hypothetical protein